MCIRDSVTTVPVSGVDDDDDVVPDDARSSSRSFAREMTRRGVGLGARHRARACRRASVAPRERRMGGWGRMSRPVSIRACGRAERERRAFVANENDARPFARAVTRSPAAWSSRCGAETRERCVRVSRAALFREANARERPNAIARRRRRREVRFRSMCVCADYYYVRTGRKRRKEE